MPSAKLSEREAQRIRLAVEVMGWNELAYRSSLFPLARVYSPSEKENGLTVWNDAIHINQLEGWDPFTSIADAWLLVEKLCLAGWEISGLHFSRDGKLISTYRIYKDGVPGTSLLSGRTNTAPEAICAAALKTLEAK